MISWHYLKKADAASSNNMIPSKNQICNMGIIIKGLLVIVIGFSFYFTHINIIR